MIKVIVNRVYEDSTVSGSNQRKFKVLFFKRFFHYFLLQYNQLKQPFKNSSYAKNRHEDVIVNPINLMTLYQKANANVYSSFAEFLADAHWIYHNNVVLFSGMEHENHFQFAYNSRNLINIIECSHI